MQQVEQHARQRAALQQELMQAAGRLLGHVLILRYGSQALLRVDLAQADGDRGHAVSPLGLQRFCLFHAGRSLGTTGTTIACQSRHSGYTISDVRPLEYQPLSYLVVGGWATSGELLKKRRGGPVRWTGPPRLFALAKTAGWRSLDFYEAGQNDGPRLGLAEEKVLQSVADGLGRQALIAALVLALDLVAGALQQGL